MARVVLGNRHAIESKDNGETFTAMPKGKRATAIDIPDDVSNIAALNAIVHEQGVWAAHAAEGAKPAWVASDSPTLAALLAEHYGDIAIRELEKED